MTTKQWILDLINEREKEQRELYRTNRCAFEPDFSMVFHNVIALHEKARRLVEKGPDEP